GEFVKQVGDGYYAEATTGTLVWTSSVGTSETIEQYTVEARDHIAGPVYEEVPVAVESRLSVMSATVLTTAGLMAETTGPLQLVDIVGGESANSAYYRGRYYTSTGCRLTIWDAGTTSPVEVGHVLLPARIDA